MANSQLITYDNHDEINEKIKNKIAPTEREKDLLMSRVNRQLSEEEHLLIFTDFLQPLEKRIYSITANNTLFDLNDLPHDVFWKLFLCVVLILRDKDRKKTLDKANDDLTDQQEQQLDKFTRDLLVAKNDPKNAMPSSVEGLSAYERLRIDALSQCQYSTFAKAAPKSDFNFSLPDDKKLERTIYSDSFRHRWKQSTNGAAANQSAPATMAASPALSSTSAPGDVLNETQISLDVDATTVSINASDMEGDDEEDENIFIANEPDIADDREVEKFKTRLLKMPVRKSKSHEDEDSPN